MLVLAAACTQEPTLTTSSTEPILPIERVAADGAWLGGSFKGVIEGDGGVRRSRCLLSGWFARRRRGIDSRKRDIVHEQTEPGRDSAHVSAFGHR